MTLTGIRGSWGSVNRALLLSAFEQCSLVLDCANFANPHALFPHVSQETFDRVFIVEIEMLYKLRDMTKSLATIARQVNAQCVIITTFNHLFNYDDKEENQAVYHHAWKLMKKAAQSCPVFVGIEQGSDQEGYAEQFCDQIQDLEV
ncbi:MAG: hypothetical protein ABIG95_01855 [Candidatus Woesearchaeota archaeon]